MNRLQNKIVLVTGAAAGIGEQICLRFMQEGAKVLGTDRDMAALETMQQKHFAGNAAFQVVALDITQRASCEKAFQQILTTWEKVDVLCNVAGIVEMGTLLEASDASWQRSLEVNMTGLYHMCQTVIPQMRKQKHGSVINVASVAGPFAVKARGAYSASKAGVIGITKSLAIDLVEEGIRVNAICPGTVESPSWHQRVNLADDPEKSLNDFIARQPMGRVGQPEEIAALAAYLAADESSYMTGQALNLDGGMTM